jgi:UDP-N-acetylglucosamine 2-epimerase (non-hydrolysing)
MYIVPSKYVDNMKLLSVVAARPNFMKIAPLIRAIDQYNHSNEQKIQHILVHTGQHYNVRMSETFFNELNIPKPDINLEIGSGSSASQLGNTMIAFEKILVEQTPDCVIVVGDVNATLSCSVIAKRMNIRVCHIEAGLRSGDMSMPEEINRLVTDRISDLLLTPDEISSQNLIKEGIPNEKIKFVGNIMIDTLEANKEEASQLDIREIVTANFLKKQVTKKVDFENNAYYLITLHRPSNVDEKEVLTEITDFFINKISKNCPVIWPIHPRTERQLKSFGLWNKILKSKTIILTEPLGYREMLRLNMGAKMVITDSGGLQEECCVLGTPCITLRWNTERPVTLREHGGASVLAGNKIENIVDEYQKVLQLERQPTRPKHWDGNTAQRCLYEIIEFLKKV